MAKIVGSNEKSLGFTFAIIAAVCWGTYGVFIKILSSYGIEGLTVVALASSVLVVFFWFFVNWCW